MLVVTKKICDAYMSCFTRKPVFGASDQVRQTGLYSHRRWLETCNLGFTKAKGLYYLGSGNKGADQLHG